MSFWQRFRERIRELGSDDDADPPEGESQPPLPSEREPIPDARVAATMPDFSKLGEPGAPQETDALTLIAGARGTEDEGRALVAVLRAGARMSEAVALACADILVARGEEDRALEVLAPCSSAPALMVVSDLHAARGQTARALGAIERVLARDVAAPGAIERHARLSHMLGATLDTPRRLDEATMVGAAPADTPFRIEREVARGGAGSVYEAFDELLERKVAFKVYHGGGDDRVAALREVRLAARFAGPFVVRVLDASPSAGWVALEWATQGSLRDWIRSGRAEELLPITRWALPLARALARIHAAGFVHADVKPTNVLLHAADAPLLSDFGIARPVGAPAVGGSAGYVSPERLGGAPCSFADDTYGFGRAVEDVLVACPGQPDPALRAFVGSCVGPASSRPETGARLVELLAALPHP